MLMYGKEPRNRKQEIGRQHHTMRLLRKPLPIPNILAKLIRFVKMQIEVNKRRCFILPKIKIDKESVIKEAAYMANTIGIENLSLKTLASQLGVKSPSLYNH